MTVLTIFNHGTGFGRAKGIEKDELIAWMHEHVVGNEALVQNGRLQRGNFIVNDGPGSGTNRAGSSNPYTQDAKQTGFGRAFNGRSGFADAFYGDTDKPSNLSGNVSGTGWDDVVARNVFLISSLIEAGVQVDTVNLAGWSRGAVLCIRTAHKLYEVYGAQIKVNIFGVDPVAGTDNGIKMDDTRDVYPNVKTACFVLSMHERRRSFSPQDLTRIRVQDPSETRLAFLPMPGVHGGQVMRSAGGKTAADITRSLGMAVMSTYGTRFTGAPNPYLNSSLAMARAYGHVQNTMGRYKANETSGFKNRVIGLGLGRRDFAKSENMTDYVRGGKDGYWVNEHHRACFKAALPNVYAAIFRGVSNQLKPLNGYPEGHTVQGHASLLTSLEAHGFLHEINGTWQVALGTGRYTDHTSHAGYRRHWPGGLPLHP